MAVISNPLASRLQLRVITGQDYEGNPIYRTQSYSNVKSDTSDDDLYSVANALADLQKNELDFIRRIDESILLEG